MIQYGLEGRGAVTIFFPL